MSYQHISFVIQIFSLSKTTEEVFGAKENTNHRKIS